MAIIAKHRTGDRTIDPDGDHRSAVLADAAGGDARARGRIVREPGDVDMGLILGIGFPPFRGGILRWCDSLGAGAVVEKLAKYCPPGQAIRADRVIASAGEDGRDVLSAPQVGSVMSVRLAS